MQSAPTLPDPDALNGGDIFISATAHKVYKLGQRITLNDLLDDGDDEPVGRKRTGAHSVRGAASLTDLINSGLLAPGENKVHISYKGNNVSATLTPDGAIEFQGRRYQSATAFSIFFKRTITPSKLGDDGWKSVLYEGRPLEHYRHIYLDRKASAAGSDKDDEFDQDGSEESMDEDELEAMLEQDAAGGGGAGTSYAPASADGLTNGSGRGGRGSRGGRGRGRTPGGGRRGGRGGGNSHRAPAGSVMPLPSTGRGRGRPKAAVAYRQEESIDEANWICCDRCDTWRTVPNADWQVLQANPKDKWFCENATWDVTTMVPHTPACKAG